MGQAKKKGTFEERQKLAIIQIELDKVLKAEEEAWIEYYKLEALHLDDWFFRRLDPDVRAFIRRAEHHRHMTDAQMLGMLFELYLPRFSRSAFR